MTAGTPGTLNQPMSKTDTFNALNPLSTELLKWHWHVTPRTQHHPSNENSLMITEGSHFLRRFLFGGGAYQPVCEIMALDSRVLASGGDIVWGLKHYQGSGGWVRALMCSIHIQRLICLEIRLFFSTKLEPFLTTYPSTSPLQLLSFFQKAQLAFAFARKS